jgi:NADH dehydrogenase FAD-containing subunit
LNPSAPSRPHVLIVGSGFGGLACAQALCSAPVGITLVDRVNFHLFQPLLYEVATAALGVQEIAATTRMLFRRQRNVAVHMLTIEAVDIVVRSAKTDEGYTIDYDWLVMAPGVVTDYFGHPEWAVHAPGLKTVEDALAVRRRVLLAFERAESEPDRERRRAHLTFVIVGGGATGVELAGAIGEMKNYTLRHDFRAIDSRDARILLLDAGERILPSFASALSARAQGDLERLGVDANALACHRRGRGLRHGQRRARRDVVRALGRGYARRTGAFRYSDRGKLAVIGRGRAVCEIGSLRLAGLPAWLIWAFVHVMFLIGFRNRVVAMLEWARTYFVQHRGGRFIIGDR